MGRVRVLLDSPEGQRSLVPGTYVIGRSEDVEVVLRSSRASRRHAQLIVSEEGATLEDLKSANGTFVNGTQITARCTLSNGDFIVIGDLGLEVIVRPLSEGEIRPPASPAPVPPLADEADGPHHPTTSRVNAMEVLNAVADRAIAAGQPEQAERVLERWLTKVLTDARSAKPVPVEARNSAIAYALRIGVGLRSKRWIDYAFELLTALAVPLTPEVEKALAWAVAQVRPTAPALEDYEAMLHVMPASPATEKSIETIVRWRAALATK